MRKVSFKNLFPAVLCVMAIFIYACMDPLTVEGFLKDSEVQSVIDNAKEGTDRIILHPEHLPGGGGLQGLADGNERIRFVPTGRYYILEHWATDDYTTIPRTGFWYLKADGTIGSTPNPTAVDADIGKLTANTVTGLNNDETYKLTQATPFTSATPLEYHGSYDPDITGAVLGDATVNANGVITIPGSSFTQSFLNLGDNYDQIIRMDGTTSTLISPVSGNIIRLDGTSTTTEYILYKNDMIDFRVLTVVKQAAHQLTINLTPVDLNDKAPIPNLATLTYSQADIYAVAALMASAETTRQNITISNFATFNSIVWRYNGVVLPLTPTIPNGNTFTLDLNAAYSYDNGLNALGVHIITIEATIGPLGNEIYYSGTIEVTVNP